MARTVGLVTNENIVEENIDGKGVLVCDICKKEFKTQKELDNHMKKEHTE